MKSLLLIGILLFSSATWSKGGSHLTLDEVRTLIGDYPAHGSKAETADFNELHLLQNSRTQEECDEATAEGNVNLEIMFAGPKGPLKPKDLKKISDKTLNAYKDAFKSIGDAKKFYQRPRPYLEDKTLKPCAPLESSFAYPSGHATMSRAYAHMLAKIWPEKTDAFLERADEIAHHRVLGGVHHPTDIEAGKKLGDAIAKSVND